MSALTDLVVVEVRAEGRVVVVVAHRHVRQVVVGDDRVRKRQKPFRVLRVGNFLAHAREPKRVEAQCLVVS